MMGRSVRVLAAVLVLFLLLVTGVTGLPGAGPAAVAAQVAATPMPGVSATPSASAPATAATVDAVVGVEKGRLGGADRMGTAVEISKAAFPDGAQVVYLARRDVLADALAAGMLVDGPVLLVPSCRGVPSVVAAEIARLDPARVVALGGEVSVCQDALEQAALGREPGRLAGVNRYATAVAISQYTFPSGPVAEVYVANGAESPDAVAGGVLTAGPVLLVPDGRATPAVVAAEIDRLSPRRVVGLGGEVALDAPTLAAAADGRASSRLAGENRYATSVAIGSFQFNGPAPVAYLARGDVFADAVASGVLTDGPVFLVSATCGSVPSVVRQALADLAPARVVALGGQGAVCEGTLDTAVAAIPVSQTPTVVVAPEVEVLTPEELAQVSSFDPATGTIVLGGGAPTVAAISEGDVVVAGYSEAVPQGFLRRVEGVTLTGAGYTLATSEASLPEAVAHTNGLVGGEPVLLASYAEPADGVVVVEGIVPNSERSPRPDGLSPDAVEVKLEHTLALNRSFTSTAGGANFTGTGSLTLDARVTVGGTLKADADISWFTLKELRLEAGPTARATASATVTGTLEGRATPALGTITRYWTFPVGPVPVVLVETSGLQIDATITTEGSVGVTTGIDASTQVGIHYRNGAISPLLNSNGTVTAPSLTGTVTAAVGLDVGPTTEVKAYGVAGLKSKAGPWATATYTADETNPLSCRLQAGLTASLAAVAGINILGLKAEMENGSDFTLTLFDEELCDTDPGPGILAITTTSLPEAHLDQPYDTQLEAQGGTPPHTWTRTGGTLPEGITLTGDGRLTGTPTEGGYHEPTLTVTDATGSTSSRTLPLGVVVGQTPDGRKAAVISAGHDHACAVTVDGAAKCWGDNSNGQLGDGTTTDRLTPVDVVGLGAGSTATISAGHDHTTCAVTVEGAAKCWGYNFSGQVGDGTTTDRLTPVDVVGLGTGSTAQIAVGVEHTCAVTVDGGAKCWGYNDGRLGDGTRIHRLIPVDVVGLGAGSAATITTGSRYTCALTVDGAAKCWGRNQFGEVGDGTLTDRLSPVGVVGLGAGSTSAISAGVRHTCAVTVEGAAKCWGMNNYGSVGDGTTTNRRSPVGVRGLGAGSTATISAGGAHTCAVTVDGAAKCWGSNWFGQVGDGTTTSRLTPVDVVGLGAGSTSAISAGAGDAIWDYTCAVTVDGAAKCWGSNSSGQVGDGTTTSRLTPVDVVGLDGG